MTKTKLQPYTLKELNIPSSIIVVGRKIDILSDDSLMMSEIVTRPYTNEKEVNVKGRRGTACFKKMQIRLWLGDDKYVPPKQDVVRVFLEELLHFMFYIQKTYVDDLKPGYLYRNESFVGGLSEILLQVLPQIKKIKDFDIELKDI